MKICTSRGGKLLHRHSYCICPCFVHISMRFFRLHGVPRRLHVPRRFQPDSTGTYASFWTAFSSVGVCDPHRGHIRSLARFLLALASHSSLVML